jgi:zinc/manganese transport system ATP-binding protein
MSAVITLKNVSVNYGRRRAIDEVSAQFAAGSLTAVAGPNGAGKSTLLKTIAGILRPISGEMKINLPAGRSIAYLPQTANINRDFPMSVLQVVCTGFWSVVGNFHAITPLMRAAAMHAIADVGLAGLEHRQISELSGGQFQRMLFARVIVQDAPVILLDEPFTAIDGETTQRLIQILLRWHAEKRTVICVLHDLLLIRKYFPESFVLAGRCLGSGHTHDLFDQKLLSFDLDMVEIQTPEEHRHDH